MARSRLVVILLFALIAIRLAMVAISASHIWRDSPDDAFITFRYAENLARGWGLTFNHELPRAEGYTSVLWAVLMAAAPLLGISTVVWSKVLGVACFVATSVIVPAAVYIAVLNRPPMVRASGALAAVLLLLSFPYVVVHTVSGMETALAAALYAVVVLAFCRIGPYVGASAGWFLGAACLVLGLTRPEANVFCGGVLVAACLRLPRAERTGFVARCVATYLAPAAVYFAWRASYYGLLFPLPFYIKAARGGVPGLFPTLAFLKVLTPMFAVPLCLGLAAKPRLALALLVPAGLVLSYFTTVDQIMGFGYRFLYPLIPVLAVVGGFGVTALLRRAEPGTPEPQNPRTASAALSLLTVASLLFAAVRPFAPDQEATAHFFNAVRSHVRLGRALGSLQWRTPKPVLAISDAGVVPYYSAMATVDLFGLNDPFIATHSNEDRSAYLLAKDPTVVVLISRSAQSFSSPLRYEDEVYAAVTSAGYTSRATLMFDESYFLWVLWRPDLADAGGLNGALE